MLGARIDFVLLPRTAVSLCESVGDADVTGRVCDHLAGQFVLATEPECAFALKPRRGQSSRRSMNPFAPPGSTTWPAGKGVRESCASTHEIAQLAKPPASGR